MKNMDDYLFNALSPMDEPDSELNRKVLQSVKEQTMNKTKLNKKKRYPAAAAITAIIIATSSVTAYAAWKYLSPKAVVSEFGDQSLATSFEKGNDLKAIETVKCGNYDISFLGLLSGKNISDFLSTDNGILIDDVTYAMVAIAGSDGTPMPDTSSEDYNLGDFVVSPYIEGYNPAMYNIFSLAGGTALELVQDGIRYRLIETQNIEAFADHTIYIGVSDGAMYNSDAFLYDEATGAISRNPEYDGVNALFTAPIDSAKANASKAAEIIRNIDEPEKIAEDVKPEEDVAKQEVKNWMQQLTPENINQLAEPIESTRQTLIPDADGNLHYNYLVGDDNNSQGAGATIPLSDVLTNPTIGAINIGDYNYSDMSDLFIETFVANEDGSVTFVVYRPKNVQ